MCNFFFRCCRYVLAPRLFAIDSGSLICFSIELSKQNLIFFQISLFFQQFRILLDDNYKSFSPIFRVSIVDYVSDTQLIKDIKLEDRIFPNFKFGFDSSIKKHIKEPESTTNNRSAKAYRLHLKKSST